MRQRLSGLILAAAALVPGPAEAHLGSTKYLDVEVAGDDVHLVASVEAVDASMELGLGEDVDVPVLEAHGADIAQWLADGITVEGRGGPCAATPGAVSHEERDARDYLAVDITYACPRPAEALELHDRTVFADDPQHESFVRVAHGDEDAPTILRRGRQTASLGAAPSWARLVGVYLVEGAIHLATGYDHVLFLLSLVLAAGLVAAKRGTREGLRDVAWIVTSFTLGHSITLAAAALRVVVLPSRPVEAVIALSIVFVAALNVIRPEARRGMPWLAAFFGLVHGFGFSSVLAEQGLPRGQTVLALVSFNVGIELAQLSFVAVLLLPLGWAARSSRYEPIVVRGGSVVIALIAGFWFLERAFGL